MPTVVVIAPAHTYRSAWIGALTASGHRVVVSPTLLAALATLEQDDVAAMVFQPAGQGELAILGAVSNARDLPPVVLMARLTETFATRVPAARQLPLDVSGAALCQALVDFAGLRAHPSRLPFRLRPEVGTQWTVRVTAAAPEVAIELGDAFDGATQPGGYLL